MTRTTMSALDGLQFDGTSATRRGQHRKVRPHVESYFLKANAPSGDHAIWLKTTVLAADDGRRFAEAWAIAFTREMKPIGAKARVPLSDASFSDTDIDARVAGCELSRSHARGSLGGGDQRIAFDLSITNDSAPLYPLARRLYALPVSSNKPTSPLPDARVSGTVTVRGETWSLDRWHGLLGHNWGKCHTHAYAWAHCNAWDNHDDMVFEMSLGKPRLGPIALPTWRMSNLRLRGVHYDLSALRDVRKNKGDFDLRRAWFEGRNDLCAVRGEFWAETLDFAGLHYDNPDDSTCYCLNSKLAHARLEVELRGRAPMVFETTRAALEIGTRDPNHGIEMIL